MGWLTRRCEPTPVGRVRVRRVPALDGILPSRGAAQRHDVRRQQNRSSCARGFGTVTFASELRSTVR